MKYSTQYEYNEGGNHMPQKLAIAIVHGIGSQKADFADKMIRLLKKQFAAKIEKQTTDPDSQLVFKPVFWASVFENEETDLWQRLKKGGDMSYTRLRLFVINYLADAIAYQPTNQRHQNYDNVNRVFADSLCYLSEKAGETAPLCVIAHSLGSVIVSNYFYDLQFRPEKIRPAVRAQMKESPMALGETLAQLFTLGSSLPLWALRYDNFGNAIHVPSPHFPTHYPRLQGGWWNLYDKDDILGYPLKTLNKHYEQSVTEDVQLNVGNLFTSWNPFSHDFYATDSGVIDYISTRLAEIWLQLNR